MRYQEVTVRYQEVIVMYQEVTMMDMNIERAVSNFKLRTLREREDAETER